jgi:hypothetical protein
MAALPNEKITTSAMKVNGVDLDNNKSPKVNGQVTVKNKTLDIVKSCLLDMTHTSASVDLGSGIYSVANHTGGTINYGWKQ